MAVVLVIFAILAAYAFPTYTQYVIRGKLASGTENLISKRGLMDQYYQQNHTYRNGTACGMADDSSGDYFALTCTTTSAVTFVWTATSKAGVGDAGDYVYTIDQAGVKKTTSYAGATIDHTGWKFTDR